MNLVLIILTSVCWWTSSVNPTKELWVVQRESAITIQGSSNIGDYWCKLNTIELGDSIYLHLQNGNLSSIDNSKLFLPVKDFKCVNFLMNRDFQNLLKAKQHRNISIQLTSLAHPENRNYAKLGGKVKITITNISRTYPVVFEYSKINQNNFTLTGKTIINLNDYKLEAPRRLGGMIRFEREVAVDYSLSFRKMPL